MQFQQRLVDAAQLLRVQVQEVHLPALPRTVHDGQVAHRRQQRLVGQPHAFQRLVELARAARFEQCLAVAGDAFEDAADSRHAQLRASLLQSEADEHQAHRLPQVLVVVGAGAPGPVAQPARGEVRVVALADGRRRVRVEQHVAVLGDEPEQQSVHQSQHRPFVVLGA
ncbi:hypothetical protein [Actinophytocola sp.]|uniref:hypothetical protein n=1 Tax=Actinophytocola sp. TaxID=1872138 RepID=UPI0025BF51F6|nr:hypothetical protein [Actinophytocola sp.]